MGISFSSTFPNLTDSQKEYCKKNNITEGEMINRMERAHNMNNPKVSIIIPVYNCEKYIQYALESALNQKYDSFEVIVIDDGSNDRTLDIITKYDKIIVLIKPNGGTASALNCGIKASKGEWIKWLSADDILYDSYLKTMMDEIEKTDDNKNKIFYSNYERVGHDETHQSDFIEPVERNKKTNQEQFNELMGYFYGNGSSTIIHKSIFERFGYYDDSLKHSEDYDMWLRASKNGVLFHLIPKVLLKYRIHPDQLTNKIGGSLDGEIRKRYV